MKKLPFILFFASISLCLLSQTINVNDTTIADKPIVTEHKANSPFMERSYFGGSVGLMFGSYTHIGVYPMYGYKIKPMLSVGTMILYEYVKDNTYEPAYTASTYGGSLFSRYRFLPQFYSHIEYSQVNYELYQSQTNTIERQWVPFLFLGGGYTQIIGGNSWMYVQVLFDVLQNSHSPYSSGDPIFSVGVGVGF